MVLFTWFTGRWFVEMNNESLHMLTGAAAQTWHHLKGKCLLWPHLPTCSTGCQETSAQCAALAHEALWAFPPALCTSLVFCTCSARQRALQQPPSYNVHDVFYLLDVCNMLDAAEESKWPWPCTQDTWLDGLRQAGGTWKHQTEQNGLWSFLWDAEGPRHGTSLESSLAS